MKTWIIRILLTIVVLIGLMIGGLNLLGGTSEAHREGLESAFSGALQGKTSFGTLTTFNIFPQLNVEIEKLYTSGAFGRGDLQAAKVKFSFEFIDLVLKRRRINSLEIDDLIIDKGVLTDQTLTASSITISPAKDKAQPYMSLTGAYGKMPLLIMVDMEQANTGMLPSYQFAKINAFSLVLGKTKVTGIYTPGSPTNTVLNDLQFVLNDHGCPNTKNGFTMRSFTGNIFPELVKMEMNKNPSAEDIDAFCKDVMRFSL